MGQLDPPAGAGRRVGAGNQSPRPEPVPGRRLGGARNRAAGPAAREDPRRSQAHVGKGDTVAATGKRVGSAHPTTDRKIREASGINLFKPFNAVKQFKTFFSDVLNGAQRLNDLNDLNRAEGG